MLRCLLLSSLSAAIMLSAACHRSTLEPAAPASASTAASAENVEALKMPSIGVGNRGASTAVATRADAVGIRRGIPAWKQFGGAFSPDPANPRHSNPKWDNGGTAARGSHPVTVREATAPLPVLAPPQRTPPPPRPSVPKPSPNGPPSGRMFPGQGSSGGSDGSGNGGGNSKPVPPPDPSSDRIAPVLAGISFSPAQIADGETSTLSISATDDLSGVHSVSGTVVSPNGKALLGFACQPAGGDLYQTRITIPKDAEQGSWFVGTIYLTDKANNAGNVNYTQATAPPNARLTVVSSNSDSTPPVLHNVAVEFPSINDGDRNNVIVVADDDRSGIASVSGVFLSPNKTARIGFSCTSDGQAGSPWNGAVVLPKNADCGEWTLQQIQLIDKANNRAVFGADNPIVGKVNFYLSSGGTCDSTPPVLQSFYVSPSSVSNSQDTEMTITATVTDQGTGVAAVTGRFDGPPATSPGSQPPRIYFSLQGNSQDPQAPWVGHVTIPKFSARGTWVTGTVQVIDKANNNKVYTAADPTLASGRFNVN